MPQLAETFDAGGRALAYQQAVAKISAAENAYFRARVGRSPVVPDNVLTVDGALLYEAINGATDAVELFQAGMLPPPSSKCRGRTRANLNDARLGGLEKLALKLKPTLELEPAWAAFQRQMFHL